MNLLILPNSSRNVAETQQTRQRLLSDILGSVEETPVWQSIPKFSELGEETVFEEEALYLP